VHFQRLFLSLIFFFSLFLLWDAWQRAQLPSVPLSASTSQVPSEATSPVDTVSKLPEDLIVTHKSIPGTKIRVSTDVLVAEISTVGGDLHRLEFLQHRDTKDKDKHFLMLQEKDSHTYITQSGLLGEGMPTHNTLYVAQGEEFHLVDGKDSVEIHLSATEASGVKVSKIYTFHRGSYLIDLSYQIDNIGSAPISPTAYFQFVRDNKGSDGDSKFVPTYTGPAIYTDLQKFQKVDFSDIDKGKANYPKSSDNGWVAMLQHYFVSAWLPGNMVQREFYTKKLEDNLYAAGVILSTPSTTTGNTAKVNISLYAGPAQTSLDTIAPGLGLTVDYGWLTVIATPLFWLLTFLHGWVGNWGVAIILLTFLIKLAFFPLSAASYRSMAKMRVVAPKLEKIKQQYGDDRERLHKSMMELYKTEKINPLGGCLPVLIQIPVFISLYWAILSSVELRHAPFFGWINDLSAADPYYILPLIMGASMLLQSKLNPAPPDPMQAKIMQIMPVVFSVVFFFFPAGLVLYSVVNNALSIAQQWYITRGTMDAAKGASNS
jgi:YidC/Oxa1 family membrane protein insertase